MLPVTMGGSGWSIRLERIAGRTPACWADVREGTLQFLWDVWQSALPSAQLDEAWNWVSMGEDSLLALGDQPDDEPVDKITFWFYLSVEWPVELAEHWLHKALASQRPRFEAMLRELGYRIAEGAEYPVPPEDRHRFVAIGERIGYPYEDGFFWSLPTYGWQLIAALTPDEQQRVELLRAGGPCQCPFCA